MRLINKTNISFSTFLCFDMLGKKCRSQCLKISTKVSLLKSILDNFRSIWGPFGVHLGLIWVSFGVHLGLCGVHLDLFGVHLVGLFEVLSRPFLDHFSPLLDAMQNLLGHPVFL